MDKKHLQQELGEVLTQSEAIRLKYQGKSEAMTGQEEKEWTSLLDRADSLQTQIKNLEKHEALQSFANRVGTALPMGDGGVSFDDKGALAEPVVDKKAAEREVYRRFLKSGIRALSSAEMKAYQADNPAGGGYLQTPQELAQEVITLMKDLVFVRGMATKFELSRADSLGIPAIDTDPSDSDWTSELGTGTEETTMAFGKRELRPHALAKRIKESNKLLRQVPDVERYVMDRLGYKFAITEEKAFLTGDGAGKPLGVFTAPSDGSGISTNRDVVAAGATAIVADDLINVLFSLKAQYRAKAVWVLNRSVLKAVRKLKDSNNNYIWATSIGPGTGFQGTPGTLLDRPYMESEYAPGSIATGLYTAIIGDFSKYYIADALDMQMQVLDQLYAETNQTGYILRRELDGMPVLEEAFARLKQA